MTQLSPIGPSLREQTIAEAQQAESAIEQQKMEEVALKQTSLPRQERSTKRRPKRSKPMHHSMQWKIATGLSTAEVECCRSPS